MRLQGKRYRDEWVPNYYPGKSIAGGKLHVSRAGKTVFLSDEEERQLEQFYMDEPLFRRLEATGHIVTQNNGSETFDSLRSWFAKCFSGPSLFIISLTKRCNLNCTYCHMEPVAATESRAHFDMSAGTIDATLKFALDSPNPVITFEFQGGEPFLNFQMLRQFVERALTLNRDVGKELHFTAVSNLLALSDRAAEFCVENGVSVSFTLNGPQDIHDHYRVDRRGHGSFERVLHKATRLRERFPGLLSAYPLCVLDESTAVHLHRIIDFFFELEYQGFAIVRMKPLGNAILNGHRLEQRKYVDAYIDALDYTLEKTKATGRVFCERMVPAALTKILSETNVGMVDWRNPSGDVTGALTIDFDGEILPADEARSMRKVFGLGNVAELDYASLLIKEGALETWRQSWRDQHPVCRNCAYNPYCGVMPVMDYARTGKMSPTPHGSEECILTLALFDWVFSKLMDNPIPLFRTLPGMDAQLESLLARERGFQTT